MDGLKTFDEFYIPEPMSGCWLWTGHASGRMGYGRMGRRGAHRMSWELHRGPVPDRLCVLHRCDTPACVNPDHLFLGTHKDNTADMIRKGRARMGGHSGAFTDGEGHRYAKLTEDAVRHILSGTISARKAAKLYNVHRSSVFDARARRTWRHISP